MLHTVYHGFVLFSCFFVTVSTTSGIAQLPRLGQRSARVRASLPRVAMYNVPVDRLGF